MEQLRIGITAPETVQLSAMWNWHFGWHLRIAVRRSGESWGDTEAAVYEGLTSEELLDVAALELATLLGLQGE